ncbi:radical SAM protein [Dactylosporangium sp. McL0621]|uniref:radical SAM protein n=1 Tax=Dactylosporangium sp. McL0621 TaxID=3415678 RepID=UPI003CF49D3F
MTRGETAYVFNAASGCLLGIPIEQYREYRRLMDGDDTADCPPGVLGNLVAGRMLVTDEADEVAGLAARYRSSRDDRSHFALTVVTSLGCNFDCPYCFEAKHPSIVDSDVQDMIFRVLDDQLPRIRTFHVTWFGGEPLVGKRPLLELSDTFIARCDAQGVAYSATIVTNGYLLDEVTCAQLRARRVDTAQVGLDGPPDVHNRMRPLASGKGSFDTILSNLRHAVEHLSIRVRVNLDQANVDRVEELFAILAAEGLAGKLSVYPGQIVGVAENLLSPSASYGNCLSNPEFAGAERQFFALAERYGLAAPNLPRPTGAPCTAVRANELVVGSRGELYKCWDTVGEHREVVGHISDYANPNGRLAKWLQYDPFSNDECRTCIALPVCMGGCAHHAFDERRYENRCGTFRHTYHDQVDAFVDYAERRGVMHLTPVTRLAREMETR